MIILNTSYFQKSTAFLFPALMIKKQASIAPIATYVAWENKIQADEAKLICVYKNTETIGFNRFEKSVLLSNPLFLQRFRAQDNLNIYVFDFSQHKEDWLLFLEGRYSQMSTSFKKKIKDHFGNSDQFDSYLNPKKYYKEYAKLLDVDEEILKSVVELCDPPNLGKENLKTVEINLENLQKAL